MNSPARKSNATASFVACSMTTIGVGFCAALYVLLQMIHGSYLLDANQFFVAAPVLVAIYAVIPAVFYGLLKSPLKTIIGGVAGSLLACVCVVMLYFILCFVTVERQYSLGELMPQFFQQDFDELAVNGELHTIRINDLRRLQDSARSILADLDRRQHRLNAEITSLSAVEEETIGSISHSNTLRDELQARIDEVRAAQTSQLIPAEKWARMTAVEQMACRIGHVNGLVETVHYTDCVATKAELVGFKDKIAADYPWWVSIVQTHRDQKQPAMEK